MENITKVASMARCLTAFCAHETSTRFARRRQSISVTMSSLWANAVLCLRSLN